MIVSMAKIEVIGPRDMLLQVLGTIQTSEVLQVDADIKDRITQGVEPGLKPFVLDGKTLAERLFYEDLKTKIDRLLALLPRGPFRETPLSPARSINSIANVIGTHLATCDEGRRRREALHEELNQLNRCLLFLRTVASLAPKGRDAAGVDFIAVQVKDPAALEHLTKAAGRLLHGAEVRTAKAEDGGYIGLLTTEKELSERLRESLRDNQIPEVALPTYLQGLPLPEQIELAEAHAREVAAEATRIDAELRGFSESWRGLYQKAREWLEDRLALLKISAALYATDSCFVLFGWIPAAKLERFRRTMAEQYDDAVIVEEKEILQHDLERVPVALKNPPYFEAFELLVRLLPLPRYTSVDPTPFVGIFFPLFFGMILGDIGYGVILLLVALGLIGFGKRQRAIGQAGEILLVAALYTVVFGALYGECFGELGSHLLGFDFGCVDRRTSILPMLYFTFAVGSVHVTVGLVLGVLSALKAKQIREAAFRFLSVVVVVCLAGVVVSYFVPRAMLMRRPLTMLTMVLGPLLLLTGGLLAPFELLRHLGNIISYARIMAVGLASVLLAYVANNLAGAAGSMWVGIAVAVMLHAFNLVLGVFAPTVHALRLHYVEFFSKFLESGGTQYAPLKKGG